MARMHPFVVALLAFAAAPMTQSPVTEVVAKFAPFDLDGDGRAEVRTLERVVEVGDAKSPLVVVLVEGRLWRTASRSPECMLDFFVRRYAEDVAAEGHRVLLLITDVHKGPPHQDGRTVLALRRLLQRLHATSPMVAAVLVGHFPDALLVRTCNWRRHEKLSLPGQDGKPVAIDAKTTNVRAVPEIVAHRCDLVLADLDGDWERCYVPGPTTLRSAWATFGDTVPERGGVCTALQVGEIPVTDVFHVRDGTAIADSERFTLHLDANDRDHECSAADRTRGNPLALPEIAVSRIDARGVAWVPDPAALGAPPVERDVQASLRLTEVPSVLRPVDGQPAKPVAWQFDARTELRLLLAYFERNHAFRTEQAVAERHRPASIAHELGSGMASLRAADAAWTNFAEAGYDVQHGATLLELAQWLQRPAVLRTLRVHSDPWGGAFAASDPAALQELLGVPWHWVKDGDTLAPSWRDHRSGRADFVFYRALHGKQLAAGGPFLLVHTGCEALSPPGAAAHAYDHPEYGQRAHAESMLFFTGCLAIAGRAKVFYDEPREFAAVLGAGQTFGQAWQRYFAVEREAKDWNDVGGDIGRKRSYFWSVVGDATLRLRRP